MTTCSEGPESGRLLMAARLLDKAEGTEFPAEQESLALRAYIELAAYLNSVEPGPGAARRRERRLLADRRSGDRAAERRPVIDLRVDHARTAYRASGAVHPAVGASLDVGL